MAMVKNRITSFLSSKKNLLIEVFLFLAIVSAMTVYFQYKKSEMAIDEVCDVLKINYLEGMDEAKYKKCLSINSKFDFDESSKIKKFNKWLNEFQISHLYIYNAKENQKMWQGQSRETGIVVKNIFNKWRVVQILAENSYLILGDQILLINGKKIKSANQVLNTEGVFTVLREGKKINFSVKYSDIVYDERMLVRSINLDWSYLKIPSFKSEFFGYDELARIYEPLNHKKIIIDVRDNFGGNFISIIRLLSMLKCHDNYVGSIFHNRTDFKGKVYLKDDLSDREQIDQVSKNNPVYLKLFKTELCLNSPKVVIIMNEKTSSVSELFVQILKNQTKDLKVFGTNSAGQMVLSIWYPIKYLGSQVMISVPYAWATSNDKEILEGQGVSPTENVDYLKLKKFENKLDPLLDYVLEKENAETLSRSSLQGSHG
jgi:C-terminal processing protease CtpA/Prc